MKKGQLLAKALPCRYERRNNGPGAHDLHRLATFCCIDQIRQPSDSVDLYPFHAYSPRADFRLYHSPPACVAKARPGRYLGGIIQRHP